MDNIQYGELLKKDILQNITLSVFMWFLGTTIIGIPIVFGIIFYQGFLLGYTISTFALTLGTLKGIIFSLVALLVQNILFIPAIFAIAVSGIKLYKNRTNIKQEIARHTIFSAIMTVIILISSMIEIFISTNMTVYIIKMF